MPEAYRRSETLRMKLLVPWSCRRADLIFTVSEYARQQIRECYGVPSEKIVVTYNAADHMAAARESMPRDSGFELAKPYLLYCGLIQPRKNVVRLVEAFDLFKWRTGLPHELVLAGKMGWRSGELHRTLATLRHRDSIRLIGYVGNPLPLAPLMAGAELFVFPSLFESFAIPVLEAQIMGVPALVADGTCFPEVFGDSVHYCDPLSVDSIAASLETLVKAKRCAPSSADAVASAPDATAGGARPRSRFGRTPGSRGPAPRRSRLARRLSAAPDEGRPLLPLGLPQERVRADDRRARPPQPSRLDDSHQPLRGGPDVPGAKGHERRRATTRVGEAVVRPGVRAGWRLVGQKLPLEGQQALVVFSEGLGDLVVFRNRRIPVACVCFTPLRAAFDPVYQDEYLKKHGRPLWRRLLLWVAGAAFRAVDRLAWRRFHRVFAISEEARSRAVRGGLVADGGIDLLHPGIEPSRMQPRGRYDRGFPIAGRIMWTKNIELGIAAFQDLLERRPELADFELLIAGFVDEKSKPYISSLRELARATPQIRFVESPSDAEMLDLYGACYALVYTPLNEDWGLVPLEAMAMGKPVISVDRGGPRETVVDGETGYRLPPEAAAFSRAMETLADDGALVRSMGAQGAVHARRFSWDAFCRTLDDYLEASAPAPARARSGPGRPHAPASRPPS